MIDGIEDLAPQTMTTVQYKMHLVAGETVAFDYDYIPGDSTNNDFAFALFANAAGFITPLLLGDVQHWIDAGHGTHYVGTSFTAAATGDYKVLIASADAGDTQAPSALVLHSLMLKVSFGAFKLLPKGVQLTADKTVLSADGSERLANGAVLPGVLSSGAESAIGSLEYAIINKPSLIGQDGAGLISQDGGGFKLADGTSLISQDGGGLISQDGAGLVATGGGNLVASGGGTVILSGAGQTALATQATDFNAEQTAAVISNDGGSVISNDGGSLLSENGGSLVTRFLRTTPPPAPTLKDPPDVGAEFYATAAATLARTQDAPSITALTNGKLVMAWVKTGLDAKVGVHAQIFNADHSKFGDEIVVAASGAAQFEPSVAALADGTFGLAWVDISHETPGSPALAGDVKVEVFGADSQPTGSAIFSAPGNRDQPSLASTADGGAILAWRSDGATAGTTELDTAQFDATGAQIGFPSRLSNTSPATPANPVAAGLVDGTMAIAFAGFVPALGDPDGGIYVHFLGAGIDSIAPVNTLTAGLQHLPGIAALARGGLAIAWVDENTDTAGNPVAVIRAQVLSATGSKVGPEIIVSTTAVGQATAPSRAALADGRFVVSYATANVSGGTVVATSVAAAAYNADGTVSTAAFPAAVGGSNLSEPVVAQAADGTLLVATVHAQGSSSDIRIEPLLLQGTAALPFPAPVATITVGIPAQSELFSRAGVVAGLSSGKSVVAWQTNPIADGGRFEIRAQMLNGDGTASGSVILVSTSDFFDQTQPTVTGLAGGAFAVGWTDTHIEPTASGGETKAGDVHAQLFDATGGAVGGPITVNTKVLGDQRRPSFASLSDGGFVASWATMAGSSFVTTIEAQRFSANGAQVGVEFAVGVVPRLLSLSALATAGLHTGGFVAVFHGVSDYIHTQDGLRGQVFDASGVGGTPFQIMAKSWRTRPARSRRRSRRSRTAILSLHGRALPEARAGCTGKSSRRQERRWVHGSRSHSMPTLRTRRPSRRCPTPGSWSPTTPATPTTFTVPVRTPRRSARGFTTPMATPPARALLSEQQRRASGGPRPL